MFNKVLFFAVLIFFVSTKEARAYLDPGSGSMIVQIVIGAVAAAFFAIKTYWTNLKSWFSKTFQKKSGK